MALKFLNNGYFAGKVGIGETNPSGNLVIGSGAGTGGTSAVFSGWTGVSHGSLSMYAYGNNTPTIKFSASDSGTGGGVTYINSGNVGIGTTSPTTKLSINDVLGISGTGNNTYGQIDLVNTQTGTSGDEIGPFITFRGKRGAVDTTIAAYGAIGAVNTGTTGNSKGALTFLVKNAVGAAQDLVEQMRITTGGNVGIGTTNPQTNLHIANSGSAAELSLERTDTSDTLKLVIGSSFGYLQNTTGPLSLGTTGGNQQLYIKTNGNVGIGTTTPNAKLHVSSSSVAQLYLSRTGSITGTYRVGIAGATNNFYISDVVQSADRLVINASGNVGIGTNSPTQKLHVDGNARVTGAYYDSNNSPGAANQVLVSTATGTDWVDGSGSSIIGGPYLPLTAGSSYPLTGRLYAQDDIYISGSHVIKNIDNNLFLDSATGYNVIIRPQATEAMRITSGGNVGIGTTSPTTKLQISATSASSPTANIFLDVDGSNLTGMGGQIVFGASTSSSLTQYIAKIQGVRSGLGNGSSDIHFQTTHVATAIAPSTKMTILSEGNVGIGTTSPDAKLEIDATLAGKYGAYIHNQSSTGKGLLVKTNNDTTSDPVLWVGRNGQDPSLFVGGGASGGNVGIGTTSPGEKLHVAGNIIVGDSHFIGDDSFDNLLIQAGGTGNLENLVLSASNDLIFYTGGTTPSALGTERLRIYNSDGRAQFSGDIALGDNVKAKFGDSGDLQIYHDGSHSYINDSGVGALKILASQLEINNAANSENIATFTQDGAVSLYYDGSKKFETTAGGTINTGTIDSTGTITVTGANGNVGINTDTGKLLLGASYDLQIYHDSSHSYIKDAGTGDLKISSNTVRIESNGAENMIIASANGGVSSYYNNVKKFETTNTGVTVTGAATATTFLGDLNGTINTATTGVTQVNSVDNTTIATTAYVNNKIGLIPAGLVFQGTWNAATNTPTLTSGSGTTGNFYIVSVAGSTNLDGITDWKVGDWAVFIEQGASDQWEKIDNSSVLDGFGTGQSVTKWDGSGTSNTLTDGPITFSGNNSTFAGSATIETGINLESGTLVIKNATTDSNGLRIFQDSSDASKIYNNYNGTLQLGVNNTTALTLGSSQSATFAGGITVVGNDAQFNHNIILEGGIFHKDDTNTSFGFPADDNIAFTTSGTERMRVNSSGNVGIGTTAPGEKLVVAESIDNDLVTLKIENNFGNSSVNGTGTALQFYGWDAGITANIKSIRTGQSYSPSALTFETFGGGGTTGSNSLAERMRIDEFGNVGIGTASPDAKLDIRTDSGVLIKGETGSTNAKLKFLPASGGRQYNFENDSSSFQIVDVSAGSTRMYFHYNGNLGIGTTAPLADLQVGSITATTMSQVAGEAHIIGVNHDLSDTQMGTLNLTSTSRDVSTNNQGFGSSLTFSQNVSKYVNGYEVVIGGIKTELMNTGNMDKSSIMNFYTHTNTSGLTAKMSIDATGNVGIGTTNPSRKLVVSGSADGIIQSIDTTGSGSHLRMLADVTSQNVINWDKDTDLRFATSDEDWGNYSERMRITSDGNIRIKGQTFVDSANTNYDILMPNGIAFGGVAYTYCNIFGDSGNMTIAANAYVANTGVESTITFKTSTAAGGSFTPMTIKGNNVGIGTDSPTSKLQLKGDATYIEVRAGDNSQAVQLGADSSGDGMLQLYSDAGLVKIKLYGEAASPSYINAGNLGIGTTTPYSKLQVVGGIQMADDTDTASANKVGTMRYRTATNEPVPVNGTDLVINGDFSNGTTGWAFGTGWAVSNGGATVSTAGVTNDVRQSISYVANISTATKFRYRFEITDITAGSLRLFVAKPTFTQIANVDAVGVYEYVVEVSTGSNGYFYLYSTSSGGSTFQGTVTNVSVLEVTEENASYADMCMQTGASTYEWVNIVRNTY